MKYFRIKNIQVATLTLFTMLSVSSFSQQTANYINNWYFGDGSGMTFNAGAPVTTPSSITAYEVTANYSDGDGNVLFYAGATSLTAYGAGFTVWDASHATMPNGDVAIDYSSSCGLTAVPVPGNCDQYYIFALSALSGANYGLRSSVIDMTLPGNGTIPLPLGDVVPGQKDVLIFNADTLAEKIKVVQKGNTENYWVITRSLNNDLFYSFEVTSGGVNPVPVVSTISATNYPTSQGSPIFSWLAVNKDRNIIAEANGFGPEVKVYSFDNLTGLLSFGEEIIPTGTFGSDIPYGIEFSPTGDALYVNWWEGANNSYITSFDMTVGFGSITPTRQDYLIATGPAEYGAMVKGPDGKIYSTRTSTTQLTVIDTPNNYLAPTIVTSGFNPAPGTCDIGMPNISYYYHPDNFIDTLAGGDRTICGTDQATIGAIAYDSIWATYSWEPALMVTDPGNAVTQTVPLSADQQFIVHVITACGDTVNTDTTMVFVSALDAGITTNAPICENEMLALWATPAGMGSGNYDWVGPNGPMAGQLANINIVPFGNYIAGGYYVVTVTDGNGCSDTDSVLVISNSVYDIIDSINVCENVLYTYPDGTTSTIIADESHVSNFVTGLGCDSIISTYVTMALPYSSTSTVNLCSGEDYTYADGTISTNVTVNESHTSSFLTSNGCDSLVTEDLVLNPTYSNTIPVNLCSGQDYTYVDGTTSTNIIANESHVSNLLTALGCDSIITEDIVISGPIAPVAGTNATYCDGDPLTDLTATAGSGGNLTWYSDAGLTTIIGTGTSFTPTNTIGSTSYFVTETIGGCESNATEIIITINPIPSAPVISGTASYCEGDLISDLTAIAGSGGTLTWYSDAGLTNVLGTGTSLPITSSLGTTTYYVTESIGNCTGLAGSGDITVLPNPIANAGLDAVIYSGESTQLIGSGGVDYLWNPPSDLSCTACSNPIATPDITTMYILTVTDANGCSDTDSVVISLLFDEQELFIPNAFSPNGDYHNDLFEIEGSGLNDFYIRVFNRWGELIFESDDQSISWDGLDKGKILNTAVFAFTLTFTNTLGEAQVVSGNVTLIK